MRKNRFQSTRLLAASALSCGALAASACGDETKPDAGSGGSGGSAGWTYLPPGSDVAGTSAGGTKGGAGGSAGSAGNASSGTAGSGGAAMMPTPISCNGKRPNQPVITSFDAFMKDRWQSPGNVDGGVYVYPDPFMPKDGEFLRFAGPVATYTGLGVWFSGCIDASKLKGVRFTMFGDAGSTKSLQFYLIVNRNRDVDVENGVGACIPANPQDPWQTCRPPGLRLPVSAAPTTQTVLWSDFKDGLPHASTDGSDILALQWSFDWSEGNPTYDAQLTIDDLAFVSADEPGAGGAAGAGGAGDAGATSTDAGAGGVSQ